jgi:hypothetical protein
MKVRHRHERQLRHRRRIRNTEEQSSKAMQLLKASDRKVARVHARSVLKRASRRERSRALLSHLFDRLGSTLFADDDPEELLQAFEPDERDSLSTRALAACVVLFGRERTAPAMLGTEAGFSC